MLIDERLLAATRPFDNDHVKGVAAPGVATSLGCISSNITQGDYIDTTVRLQ